MRSVDQLKAFPAILIVSFSLTLLIVNVQASSWTKASIPNDVSLVALDMVNSSDGWAVGGNGTVLHWDGTCWSNIPSSTTADFKDVEMVSSNEGYAIVVEDIARGPYSIYRWDGTSWTNSTAIDGATQSIDIVNPSDGWAVGLSGVIFHWDGISWNRVESPINYPLESIDMVSSTDGWAVGQRAVIIRWNGTSWNLVRDPEFSGAPWLWSVDMVNSTDGWAMGSGGDIMRWDGTHWEYVTSPVPSNKHLFSVDMINSTDGWAVGSDGVIIHWDGTSWSNTKSPTSAWLNSVDMINSTEGWILGADGIYHLQLEKETSNIPIEYLLAIGVVIAVVVVLFFLIRRNLK